MRCVPERLFVFIQFEFPWALGPAGRALPAARGRRTASPSAWSCSGRSARERPGSARRHARRAARRTLRERGRERGAVPRPPSRRRGYDARDRHRPGLAVGREPGARVARGARPRARGARGDGGAQPRPARASHRRRRPLRARGLARAGARDQGRLGRRRAGRRRPLAARARAAARRAAAARARRGARGESARRRCVPQERLAALLGGRASDAAVRGARAAGAPRPRRRAAPRTRRSQLDAALRGGARASSRRRSAPDLALRVAELEKLRPQVSRAGAAAAGRRGRAGATGPPSPPRSTRRRSSTRSGAWRRRCARARQRCASNLP